LDGCNTPGQAFAPVIVFIPRSAAECKPEPAESEWLPRRCSGCDKDAVIGHGRRRRQAHDEAHSWILVRRGRCTACGRTMTVLPAWCVPGAIYTLPARQQAVAASAQGHPVEQCAPHCRDPDRVADASTLRRWFRRRLESLRRYGDSPTMLAWDWLAAGRSLILEAISP
jgi:hypothetical protein